MKLKTTFVLLLGSWLLGAFVLLDLPTQPIVLKEDSFADEIERKLAKYQQQRSEEKIYLHTDKPLYFPGENIWLAGYLQAVGENAKVATSDILYIELLNPQGKVTQKKVLPVMKGKVKGDFFLESTLPGGLYKLRAYTQWMKNSGESHYFSKTIALQKVLKPNLLLKLNFQRKAYGAGDEINAVLLARDLKDQPIAFQYVRFQMQLAGKLYKEGQVLTDGKGKATIQTKLPKALTTNDGALNLIVSNAAGVSESVARSIPIVLNNIALEFFPEGGHWVHGMSGKVAFKAVNEFGKPADIAGVVVDESGREVISFSSYHQGMGAFSITPDKHKKYLVRITQPSGIRKLYPLPVVEINVPGLAVNVARNQLLLRLGVPQTSTMYLVAQSGGKVRFSQKLKLTKGISKQTIAVDKFPIGITKITLFDEQKRPRCERLVFVNPHQQLQVQIKLPKKNYQPREQVEAEILTTNAQGKPVSANLSIAVTDDKVLTLVDDKQDNLLSYLLMSEALKGKVHEPNFYFKKNEPKAVSALDYVMLTHGWRRYEWKEVLSAKEWMASHKKELTSIISGQVKDQGKQQPIEAWVTLVELGGQKRALRIKTDKEGNFTFKNTNPFTAMQLFARSVSQRHKHCKIIVDNATSHRDIVQIIRQDTIQKLKTVRTNQVIKAFSKSRRKKKQGNYISGGKKMDVSMEETSLAESVITVYEPRLRGRVSGVKVTPDNGVVGATPGIAIRGYSSIQGHAPLFVVNGLAYEDPTLIGHFLVPENVSYVKVLKGVQASTLYGDRGRNGVVIIQTHDKVKGYLSRNRRHIKYMATHFIPRMVFSEARIFYPKEYKVKEQNPKKRTDFKNTIYWNPEVITDKDGKAKITFWNNDALTTFRITAEGIGAKQQLGRVEQTYYTKLPLELTAKIPPYLSVNDRLQLPVYLTNNTNKTIEGKLQIKSPKALNIDKEQIEISIPPQTTQTRYVTGVVKRTLQMKESAQLELSLENATRNESFSQELEIIGRGFFRQSSFSGQALNNQFQIKIPETIDHSLEATLVAYPNILSDLIDGIAAVVRRPHGCFEQVSSSTYPNILALQFLEKNGQATPRFKAKALRYIAEGYKKLVAYETRVKGFEWYGKTPPHEGLTAFGLLEFLAMKKVYKGVNNKMLARTQQWLLSRKDGKGGFKQNRGKYGFAAASKVVNNAYIVYALSQAGEQSILKEYEAAYQEALANKDAYRMALMALASANLGKEGHKNQLLDLLRNQIATRGLGNLLVDHTLVRSGGVSKQIETSALIVLAEMRESTPQLPHIKRLIDYLLKHRSNGYFGSTQGTILSLQALTSYAALFNAQPHKGKLLVYKGRQKIGELGYSTRQLKAATLTGLGKYFTQGIEDIVVRFENERRSIPFTLSVSYRTTTPSADSRCNIALKTQLMANQIKVNETVRLTTTIRNKQAQGQPSTIALVGIPAGLSPQLWQLKELQEKGKIAYYEIYGTYVVLYFREMGPHEIKQIALDLKAEIPGRYQAPASSAYLYYTSEHKDWQQGTWVLIRPNEAN